MKKHKAVSSSTWEVWLRRKSQGLLFFWLAWCCWTRAGPITPSPMRRPLLLPFAITAPRLPHGKRPQLEAWGFHGTQRAQAWGAPHRNPSEIPCGAAVGLKKHWLGLHPTETSQRWPHGGCEPSAALSAPCWAAHHLLPLLGGRNSPHFKAFITWKFLLRVYQCN